MNNHANLPITLKAAWIAADNCNKRTKGQWHQWLSEAYTFIVHLINK